MGDRGNIVLDFNRDPLVRHGEETVYSDIYLYTHWNGYIIQHILASALDKGCGRWNDPSYLARIIFNRLTSSDPDGETGFGLSPYETDNEYAMPRVLLEQQRVEYVGRTYTFAEFVARFKRPENKDGALVLADDAIDDGCHATIDEEDSE